MTDDKMQLVIITGMSGAGKTVAMQCLEDMGYFCIDNMPPGLFEKFWEIMIEADNSKKVALVVDLRSGSFFQEVQIMLNEIANTPNVNMNLVFLDASDQELVARYKETRRLHPMAMEEGLTIDGIHREREMLETIRGKAQVVIDTTHLSARQLRERIIQEFSEDNDDRFHIEMMSFGFKYGIPIDADIVMDVRFLPNPYYIKELRTQTGTDKDVYDYVMSFAETEKFYQQFKSLLDTVIPGYRDEGKKNVTIAIGCTGGQHRSVAIAERLFNDLTKDGYRVNITHRNKDQNRESVMKS